MIDPPSLNQALCLGKGFSPMDLQALWQAPIDVIVKLSTTY